MLRSPSSDHQLLFYYLFLYLIGKERLDQFMPAIRVMLLWMVDHSVLISKSSAKYINIIIYFVF